MWQTLSSPAPVCLSGNLITWQVGSALEERMIALAQSLLSMHGIVICDRTTYAALVIGDVEAQPPPRLVWLRLAELWQFAEDEVRALVADVVFARGKDDFELGQVLWLNMGGR